MAELVTRRNIEDISPETVIIFYHIHKCAGTSIYTWFEGLVGADRLRGMYMKEDLLSMKDHPDPHCKVVIGHFVRGVHHSLPPQRKAAYCTMLRDPVRTALSSYTYGQSQLAVDNSLDIETYLLEYRPNPFVWHLGGDDFEKAKTTLFETYAAFGLVEHYDQSLRHFASNLLLAREHAAASARCNVSSKKHPAPDVSPDILAQFRAVNAADLALYELAVAEFRSRVARDATPVRIVDMAAAPPRVEYTPTFQDVERALEDRDYLSAVSLLATKHLDDLPHHALAPAARLAVFLKDHASAGLMFGRLRQICPFFYQRDYVDYLLAVDDIPGAIAAVAEECRQYEDWPDSRPDSDLFWFKVEALCLLLFVTHKATAGLDAALCRRLEELCRFSEHATSWYQETLMRIHEFAVVLRLIESPGALTIPESIRFRILSNTATCSYLLGKLPEAEAYCRQALEQNALDANTITLTVLLHRLRGGDVRDLREYESLVWRFPGRRFTRGIAKELAVGYYARGDADTAFAIMDTVGDGEKTPQLDGRSEGFRAVPFAAVDCADVVVIKAGPQMVFDYLWREYPLLKTASFDLIGGLTGPLPENIRKATPLPTPRYDHARDGAAVVAGLGRQGYQAAVVVMSDFDFAAYEEILTLARALSDGPVYLFSFDHMLSRRHRHAMTRLD